jgi:hypothetical protein
MANRKFWLGMAVMVLAFSFVLSGCPTDGGETDTWSDVKSLDQLNGTWKGSYSQTLNMKQAVESQGGQWSPTLEAMFGSDMKVTTILEMTYTINSNAKTQATTMKQTMTFSGSKVGDTWSLIKTAMTSGLGGEGVDVNSDDVKHSITITQTLPAESMDNEYIVGMLSSGLKINQNGNKVKIPANAIGEGFPEMTMAKQ